MKRQILTVLCLCAAIVSSQAFGAATFEWTGAIDSDWAKPGNWNVGGSPATYLPGQSPAPSAGVDTERVGNTAFGGPNPVYNYDNRDHIPAGTAHARVGGAAQAASFTMQSGYYQRTGQVLYIGWGALGQWYHQGGTFTNRNEQVQVGRGAKGYLEVSGGSFLTSHLHVGVQAGSDGSEVLIKGTGALNLAPNTAGLLTLGSTGASRMTVQGGTFFNSRTGATANIVKNNSEIKLEGGMIDMRGNLTVSDTSRVLISGGEFWIRNNTLVLQGSSYVRVTGGAFYNTGAAAFNLNGTSHIELQGGFTQTPMLSFADDSYINFTGGVLELTGATEQQILDWITADRLITTLPAGVVDYDDMGSGVFHVYANTPYLVLNPNPPHGATQFAVDAVLAWEQSDLGVGMGLTYRVYLGTDPNAVTLKKTTTDDPADFYYLPPTALAYNTLYFWRVDTLEPNIPSPIVHMGKTWSFTTAPPEPQILTHPVGLTVQAGVPAQFLVTAVNAESYQWYKDGVALTSSAAYSGQNTNTLTIHSAQVANEGFYHCVASNTLGPPPAPSDDAQLLTRRLVGWWKLDGNLTDSVATVVPGAPAFDGAAVNPDFVAGLNGNALAFDGTLDRVVEVPYSSDFYNFYPRGYTVSVWAKVPATTVPGYLVGKTFPAASAANRRGFHLQHSVAGDAVHFLRPLFTQTAGVNVYGDQWYLITGTYDRTTGAGRIYVNGELRLEQFSTAVPEPAVGNVRFGADGTLTEGVTNVPLVGQLDDVRIYSYPISPLEIAHLYTNFKPGEQVCLEYPEFDFTGPLGEPDCVVDIYDFAEFASHWLDCNIVPDCL